MRHVIGTPDLNYANFNKAWFARGGKSFNFLQGQRGLLGRRTFGSEACVIGMPDLNYA